MQELQRWVEFTKKYPPAEIFYQSNKEKQERKCKQVCEPLFTFEPTNQDHPAAVLRRMWSSWRDLEVLLILGISDMQREHVVVTAGIFKQHAKEAIRVMEEIYKPDQALWNYYKIGSMSVKMMTDLVECEIRPKN